VRRFGSCLNAVHDFSEFVAEGSQPGPDLPYDVFILPDLNSPLTMLRAQLAAGAVSPAVIAADVIAHANSNASQNTYLSFDPADLRAQAASLALVPAEDRPPLWSVPVALKDCFDLAGVRTTCGSRAYAEGRPVAANDSSIARTLRATGALITGKTHLHPLAYGITGENAEYGDCLQPRDATLLTGGSSSGSAAAVQEGSALAAIGTDTGGSIRVPAALCGIVGYRASQDLPTRYWQEAWHGGAHLAPTFDTLGLLMRDLRDVAPLAQAIFRIPAGSAPVKCRIGCVPEAYLSDADANVMRGYRTWKDALTASGYVLADLDASGWEETYEIFTAIQAHEAALLHRGRESQFGPAIEDRLRWGASLSPETIRALRARHRKFLTGVDDLLARFDLLMLPCSPVSRLRAGEDHSAVRPRILRYTTPFSLAGLPALSVPGELLGAPLGTGVQIAGAPGSDPQLLAFAEAVGRELATGQLSRV
jgi:Asp-tRNA(Asn)/Glu-tRNA(Gln) amidotransferase A subunit family amidase